MMRYLVVYIKSYARFFDLNNDKIDSNMEYFLYPESLYSDYFFGSGQILDKDELISKKN